MCSTKNHFTNTNNLEGGRVLVSATSKAGHFVTGTHTDPILMKACVTNGPSVTTTPTDA